MTSNELLEQISKLIKKPFLVEGRGVNFNPDANRSQSEIKKNYLESEVLEFDYKGYNILIQVRKNK